MHFPGNTQLVRGLSYAPLRLKVAGNPGGYDHNMVLFNLTDATARERVRDCQAQPR